MKLQQLKKKEKDLRAEARGIIAKAKEEKREITEEEDQRLDAIETELIGVKADIDKEERRDAREREFLREAARSDEATGIQVAENREALDPKGGFRNLADFALAVRTACLPGGAAVDARLAKLGQYYAAPTNFHQEGHTQEGYMVPPQMRQGIFELVFAEDDILGQIGPEPTESNSVEMLADETTPWGATGVVAKWRAEGTQMTASKLVTEARQVRLHELYAFVTATDELLQDAPRLNDRLTRKAAQAIQWEASEAIMNGSGAGKPLGWMLADSLITVLKEAAQIADTIVAKNLTKMYSRLLSMPGSRPAWYANRDIVPQLVDLKIGTEPSWVALNQGLRDAPNGMLLGIPLRFTEHAETLGDKGDIQLVDLAGYYATTRTGAPEFASSIHLFFDYGIQAFRWTFRLGGQPYLKVAVSPAKGATTKSHFVCIEART